jgi:methionyl aminopeptidase
VVELKSPAELERMRVAGQVLKQILTAVRAAAAPGVTLLELDERAAAIMREHNARPSFLGYRPSFAPTPFPAVICASVNDVIVHGIPSRRKLASGDLLSIDCAVEMNGFHADSAITFPVGESTPADKHLVATTQEALAAGIAAARPGARLGDISAAIGKVGRAAGYGIPDGFGGHGIGRAMHEDPSLANDGEPGRGLRLRPGLALAIEPMLISGGVDDFVVAPDGWALRTADGSRAAHIEHSIGITDDGPIVLTG